MLCPNFETCEGELRFKVSGVSQGEGPWEMFMGYEAELEEQTCDCVLTEEQMASLEQAAADDSAWPYDP